MFCLQWCRKKATGHLIIQTAKIGDYANTTPMITYLGKTDMVIDDINRAFADYDERIETIYCINTYKKGILLKLKLAWILYTRHYEKVYVVMPNSLNLFLGLCCYAKETTTLQTYASKWYFFLLSYRMKVIHHHVHDLTIHSYLSMIDEGISATRYWKQLQQPLYIPKSPRAFDNKFRIGLSLSAGNKIKTIDQKTWDVLFSILNKLDCVIYVFGLKSENVYLEKLQEHVHSTNPIISLLGEMELKELPYYISHMHLYISSDTGNSYVADSVKTPTINFAGPCFWQEQRPLLETSLVIPSNALCAPYSSVFITSHEIKSSDLYDVNENQVYEIEQFIHSLYKSFLSNQHTVSN